MTCAAIHEGQNCKSYQSIMIITYCRHICTGLEYQEDLKIRAANDVTARKDQEHLEVRLTLNRINKYFSNKFLFIGDD
jgi:hypothetical protein